MAITVATTYAEAVKLKTEGVKDIHAMCPVCGIDQLCFVDMPESSERPEVACMECCTPIYRGYAVTENDSKLDA